jgi:nucleoside-diphosphate-sugar epimerase
MATILSSRKIAILGSTSHIAKGLIHAFCSHGTDHLLLFARAPERTATFLRELNCHNRVTICTFDSFDDRDYDVIINCIGAGDPARVKALGCGIFTLTEAFDNQILAYVASRPETIYLNFSSGAVYGTSFSTPAGDHTAASIDINHLIPADWYGVAKLHAEAKHRALPNLRIIDIRIFAYFSRFIDLQARFLLTDAINCIREKRVLETGPEDIVRDYLHPEDLYALMMKCIETETRNDVFDACSREPIAKFQALDFLARQYGLRYKVVEHAKTMIVTGLKMNYYSTSTKASTIGYSPRYTSLDCIRDETQVLLRS